MTENPLPGLGRTYLGLGRKGLRPQSPHVRNYSMNHFSFGWINLLSRVSLSYRRCRRGVKRNPPAVCEFYASARLRLSMASSISAVLL